MQRKPARLIVVGPLPPPLHGVTISTSLVLANPILHERFAVQHLDTSDHRSGRNIGRWDITNVVDGDRIAVVPNGTPEIPRNGHRRSADTVLFLSNLTPRKGVTEAVQAARRVIRRHPQARFVFAGGWRDDRLAEQVQALASDAGG